MRDLKDSMVDILRRLQSDAEGEHHELLAQYEDTLMAFHKEVLKIGRSKKPGNSILARIGLGDLAWVLHLNADYKEVRESLPVLNALTPEPSPEDYKRRPPWPQGFKPTPEKKATLWNPFSWGYIAVAVKNKLAFPDTHPKKIFTHIQDAKNWENYYTNGGNPSVSKLDKLGQVFSFRTFNMTFKSKLVIYKNTGEVLSIAWYAKSLGTEVVHRWDIYSDGKGGSIVSTEERQRGIKPVLTAQILKPAMEITHQNWLYGHAVAAIKARQA